MLLIFIALFITGYVGYLFFLADDNSEAHELIAPAMFFTGAAFVALMTRAMMRTLQDVRRLLLLEAENITDTLTGLRNRRDFDRRWNAELGRARRFRLPLTLMMLDIDHFKKINDTHGHAIGELNAANAIAVSIGIAGRVDASQGDDRLFENADRALYQAKKGGRNRVVVAAEPGA